MGVRVSAGRINSLIGFKHNPGEKKPVNSNIGFPVFFGLILLLSKLLKCWRSSEENDIVEKEFKIQTLKSFCSRLDPNTQFGSYVENA